MKKFYWGTATSSFQIEGNIENDFTQWEREGRFKKHNLDPVYDNGSNHWLMWQEDFQLMKELGVNAYRFSIEWSRIQPEYKQYSEKALDQYEKMIDFLLANSIEPFLTLHHFSHPIWFHEKFPWHQKESSEVFAEFVDKIVKRLKDRVKFWITLNEPLVWVMAGYGEGNFSPGYKDLYLMMEALSNILISHIFIYDLIKTEKPDAEIGIANHFIVFKDDRQWMILDRAVRNKIHTFFNKMMLDAFRTNQLVASLPPLLKYEKEIKLNDRIDFWGINYYYRLFTKFKLSLTNPFYFYSKHPETDTGWEIYPKGLYKTIKLVADYGKKIFITENGIATNDETIRKKFIKKHLKFVKKAISKGYDINGYFYWSLLDNYEWIFGKSKRFGLIFVDYEQNFKRIKKESFNYYKEIIQKTDKEIQSIRTIKSDYDI